MAVRIWSLTKLFCQLGVAGLRAKLLYIPMEIMPQWRVLHYSLHFQFD